MSTKRKPLRARRAMPERPAPTENQIEEAMLAYARVKVRYRLLDLGNDRHPRFIVEVLPEMMVGDCEFMGVKGLPPVTDKPIPADLAFTRHTFTDEPSARQFCQRGIIREAITAGMRAKP